MEYGLGNAPMYTLEVFTRKGTGMISAVYDKGAHYTTNQKLTLQY